MRVLLTNDDGISSPGLAALANTIKEIAEVVVVAPDTEQSAVGHAITVSFPLRVKEFYKDSTFFGYAVKGTPADCVKLAIKVIMDKKPDMVISGINLGANTGTHIIYSGTVSAATEATILEVPAFAISIATYEKPDYTFAALFARKLTVAIRKNGLPKGVLLNVNVPAVSEGEIRGVRLTVQGETKFIGSIEKRIDPRGQVYYWLSPEIVETPGGPQLDTIAIRNNEVSITPLHFNMTSKEGLEKLREWSIFGIDR